MRRREAPAAGLQVAALDAHAAVVALLVAQRESVCQSLGLRLGQPAAHEQRLAEHEAGDFAVAPWKHLGVDIGLPHSGRFMNSSGPVLV